MNRNAVYSNLFCLCDAPLSDEGEAQGAERLQEPFAGLLPHLDFSSTCYLISRKRPGEATYFEDLLQEVSAFLEQNRFLQASVRPVHPFSGNDANAWIETYLRFLRACKPFQQEGYREQIIARLRVFPVIFLKDAAAVMEAGPFLSFLQETFFLPSILVPSRAIDEVASLSTRQDAPPGYVSTPRTLPLLSPSVPSKSCTPTRFSTSCSRTMQRHSLKVTILQTRNR
jgi:hypothetical protein